MKLNVWRNNGVSMQPGANLLMAAITSAKYVQILLKKLLEVNVRP
jgi:hypothetical protein